MAQAAVVAEIGELSAPTPVTRFCQQLICHQILSAVVIMRQQQYIATLCTKTVHLMDGMTDEQEC